MALKHEIGLALLLTAFLTAGLLFLFFKKSPKSEIIISDSMSEFIDAIDRIPVDKKNQLIVFDLDDTVYYSSVMIGSPTWYYNLVNILRHNGIAKSEAHQLVGDIDHEVQKNIDVVVVEYASLRAIKSWQEAGAVVVAINSRPYFFSDVTERHLRSVGLDFNASEFSCVYEQWGEGTSGFKNGVLYVGQRESKIEVFDKFFSLLEECGVDVELIAQADDQQRYISEFSQFASKENKNYIGIIYGGALARQEFELLEANRQLVDLEAQLNRTIIPHEYRSIMALSY